MKKTIVLIILAIVFALPTFAACDKNKGEPTFAEWQATDLNADGKTDETDYNLWIAFNVWLDTEEAEDFNQDRKITFDDYNFFNEFKTWKISNQAMDFNGDRKINMEDYLFYIDPDKVDYVAWLNSVKSYDFDKNGKIDETDFGAYLGFKDVIGDFRICDFVYNCDRTIFLTESKFDMHDLANCIADMRFSVSDTLKLSCEFGDDIKEKLGQDFQTVKNAIDTCTFEKLSKYVSTVSFEIGNGGQWVFTLYLTKTDGGFSSVLDATIDQAVLHVSFNVVYD